MISTVLGYCPVGCGETLYLTNRGYIMCSSDNCVRPSAAADILADHETEHIVKIDKDSFTVRHPLRERLDDQLLDCWLDLWLAHHTQPVLPKPGRYRVYASPGRIPWTFVRILGDRKRDEEE